MAEALQIDLERHSPWAKRGAIIGIGLTLVMLLGWLAPARHQPTELLSPGGEQDYLRRVERMFAGAKRRIWVMLFVIRPDAGSPVDGLLSALADAKSRGVDVRVVLDRPRADAGADERTRNREAATWLTDHGIAVTWDEAERTTHAKVLLIDDRAIIGSHNWTRSALLLNRELSVVTTDRPVISGIEQAFLTVPGFVR